MPAVKLPPIFSIVTSDPRDPVRIRPLCPDGQGGGKEGSQFMESQKSPGAVGDMGPMHPPGWGPRGDPYRHPCPALQAFTLSVFLSGSPWEAKWLNDARTPILWAPSLPPGTLLIALV